jgi:hypothetical protein
MNRIFAGAALVLSAVVIQPAQACRVMLPAERRIESFYQAHTDLQVAIVSIADARHLSNDIIRKLHSLHRGYEAPWRATALVTKMLVGRESPELVMFDRNWGSAACDDGTTMPRRGDKWIIYYTTASSIGMPIVLDSYPLSIALKADQRLRERDS